MWDVAVSVGTDLRRDVAVSARARTEGNAAVSVRTDLRRNVAVSVRS
jgi:hypothetical protein